MVFIVNETGRNAVRNYDWIATTPKCKSIQNRPHRLPAAGVACVSRTTFGIHIAAKFEARHRNLVIYETVNSCLHETEYIDFNTIDVINII